VKYISIFINSICLQYSKETIDTHGPGIWAVEPGKGLNLGYQLSNIRVSTWLAQVCSGLLRFISRNEY
jgi:hypothetical protein